MGGSLESRDHRAMNAQNGVAIVTGAGRGRGREIAWSLARAGMAVAATDIDGASATATAAAIVAGGGKAVGWRLDVCDGAGIDEAFAAVTADLGVPLALVNNAGIYPD